MNPAVLKASAQSFRVEGLASGSLGTCCHVFVVTFAFTVSSLGLSHEFCD